MNKFTAVLLFAAIIGSTIAGDYGPSNKHGKGGDRPGGKRPVIKTPVIKIDVPTPDVPDVLVPNVPVPNPSVPRVPRIPGRDVRVPNVPTPDVRVTFEGAWGPFGPFSQCTRSCGGGIRTRSRSCLRPARSVGRYIGCKGLASETVSCGTRACPVDGQWGEWGPFSICTRTCGGGIRTRRRSCDSPAPSNGGRDCRGNSVDIRKCDNRSCPKPTKNPKHGHKY